MDRRTALAKATQTTANSAGALLTPEQSTTFVRDIKEKGVLLNRARLIRRNATSGEINKIHSAARIIRKAPENLDDGFRAGVSFGTVPYATEKLRLPFEVTEDLFHENIEGQSLESTVLSEMTQQFSLDLEDLFINGDTSAVNDPFLSINDGILKQLAMAAEPGRNIDAVTINGGVMDKALFFALMYALPNKYRSLPNLCWMMSPNRALTWYESLTDRPNDAGAALLAGMGGDNPNAPGVSAVSRPLGRPILEIPAMPDDTILFGDPSQFVQVVTWDVRRRKVTGATDYELAARDARFYVFFLKNDFIVEETRAVARMHGLPPIQ